MGRRHKILLLIALGAGLSAWGATAWGQPVDSTAARSAPEETRTDLRPTYPVGPMEAYPIITLTAGYGKGIFLDEEGGNQDSFVFTASAGGGLQGERRGHLYGVEYVLDAGTFTESTRDDFFDHTLVAYGGTAFNLRNHVDVAAEYKKGHDPRYFADPTTGGGSSLEADEVTEWDRGRLGATYKFGAPGARGSIECGACFETKNYNNNDQEFRDRDVYDLGAVFDARVTPKIHVDIGAVFTDFDYTNETEESTLGRGTLDNDESRIFVGGRWDLAAKTSLHGRVGYLQKDFDSGSREDYEDIFWDLIVDWIPRPTSTISLGAYQSTFESVPTLDETAFIADFVKVTEANASWNESWTNRVQTDLRGYYREQDWEPTDRTDDVYGAFGTLTYQVNRWLDVGLTAYYRKNESNFDEFNYEDRGASLTFNIGGSTLWGRKAPSTCNLARASRY